MKCGKQGKINETATKLARKSQGVRLKQESVAQATRVVAYNNGSRHALSMGQVRVDRQEEDLRKPMVNGKIKSDKST